MSTACILKIAVPTPLRRVFDYLPPATFKEQAIEKLQPGTRVLVPLGQQRLVGILLGVSQHSELSHEQLKPAYGFIENEPCLSSEVLTLCQWAASYYQCPIGEALATALPVLLRQGEAAQLPRESYWQLTTAGKGLPATALARAPKQALLLQHLLQHQRANRHDLDDLNIAPAVAKQLEKKGLVETAESLTAPSEGPLLGTPLLKEEPLALNTEQQAAMDQLRYQAFNAYLLEGATGSGKTEVYLQAVEHCLRRDKGALILVPEIGLTPQLVGRVQQRFGVPVAALHSGLNDRERLQAWLEAAHGRARIVIGTRSAVFTPIPELGIIIIDEEHDLSFKQQDGFRYSARDLAVMRAKRLNIPLLLGTATPSLETLYNTTHNRYLHLRLTERAGDAKPPTVDTIDLRGKALTEGFSDALIDAVATELERGNQVLVFLNRRGFAPILMCHDCGWMAQCNHCSARMTVHQHPPHLHCHHCDHQRHINQSCPDCLSRELAYRGLGTERSEAALTQLFPNVPVIRIDRDTTRRKQAMAHKLEQVQQGQPCILVGTQMLAKGHHFPDITLVAILDVDGALFSPDFRGPERMGQLLIQVAGRAGRGAKSGKVIIQSHHCDHPNIQSLIKEGYHRYARRLLHERQVSGLPPYRYLALLRAESKRAENAIEVLKVARQLAQRQFPPSRQLSYLGPIPALLEKKKDRYCFQLHISSEHRLLLQQLLQQLCGALENHAASRRARWSVDVDPQDMS